ncbi:nucleolar protein [Sporothrix eucalyptigena]
MVKGKNAKAAATEAAPRKSSRISEQVVKRKAAEESSPVATKKRKAPEEPVKETKAKTEKKPAPAKQTKKKAAEPEADEEDKENDAEQTTVAVEDDATTKALVQEIDGDDDNDNTETAKGGASLFKAGQDVGKAPAAAVKKAAEAKAAKSKKTNGAAAKETSTEESGALVAMSTDANGAEFGGVVYVGRIPHGFFEHEMRSYFSQFGDIRRLRLSRNRKTGASKHYAFIEFADREVADIVAKTMDNYLLFGHLLRCSVVPPERIPANLFKGANRRFKAVPWNRMAGRKLAQPKPESEWTDKISRETKKRAERAALLESKLGYSFTAPTLKTTDTVEAPAVAEEEEEDKEEEKWEAPKQLEQAPPAEDPVAAISAAPAKGKKGKGKKVAA